MIFDSNAILCRLLEHELNLSPTTTTLPQLMSGLSDVDRLAQAMQAMNMGPPQPQPQHPPATATSNQSLNF